REQAWHHPRTQTRASRVRHPTSVGFARAVAPSVGQKPQEVRFARTVAAEDGDPFPVVEFGVERLGEPVEREALAHDSTFAGPSALQPHTDPLLARYLLRRAGFVEPAQPTLGGLVARSHAVVVAGLVLEIINQADQSGPLL